MNAIVDVVLWNFVPEILAPTETDPSQTLCVMAEELDISSDAGFDGF